MPQEKLLDWFRPFHSCIVAFSGGLDSSVVAKAAAMVLGEKALAIMAVSPTSFRNERKEAEQVANAIGIRFQVFPSPEMELESFYENGPERCYYCKWIRFQEIKNLADEQGVELLVDGSNGDDRNDYRPGHKAVKEFGFQSPLAELGFDKNLVREIARAWKLPNCEKPASPCLATRIAYGLPITEERLRRIEAAEDFLLSLGFSPLRVRLHPNDLARIEVPQNQLERFFQQDIRGMILEKFKELGFSHISVDLDGFRSGSMNVFQNS